MKTGPEARWLQGSTPGTDCKGTGMDSVTSTLGMCVGASTIGLVCLKKTDTGIETSWTRTRNHEGNPRRALQALLGDVSDLSSLRVAATGRKFRKRLALATISEPEAVELATAHVLPPDHPYRVIISAGGETFMVYHLDDEGRIQGIHTGNKCASGTGEFFLQQLGRMNVTLEEAGRLAMPETYHRVSGRCSVFCKSDCTHALNKGVPKPQVVAGLARMMAGKTIELLKKLPKASVMLVGGCSQNGAMVHYLREEIDNLLIPAEATWFEALGAALWAFDNETVPLSDAGHIFSERGSGLSFLKPLSEFKDMAEFKSHPRGQAWPGDRAIIGLDVGSTTTKGVLLRKQDKAILAAEYLRTNGDPVGASRQVYASLARQVTVPVEIEGLGVTGSGRQIAGLHAMTDGVINEIIAHATAAVHFDPEVDTIFEIGGQDAKYTYITNGVPSDYAMNEACSAGTGSFLEESAKESLGMDVTEIGPTALKAASPPNFNDQCAAFIGSDIKGAVQEGIPTTDIVAGLVYSVCMNYTNRVKGNRPVGRKVFVQGGVCYNQAIPAAMAALTGKRVVVPPEPGLMGAFGVALEVERRLAQGLIEPARFDLQELAEREVKYLEPFRCNGGRDDCDRACEISRIEVGEEVFPFGGICNRFDNIIHNRRVNTVDLDLAAKRERRLFRDLSTTDPDDGRPTVGLNRSFLVNTYFPLYNRFFSELGFRVVLPDTVDPCGADQQGAAFCFPAELAHGYAADLLAKNPDYFFVPHLRGVPASSNGQTSCTCVFLQGETYYLQAAFPEFDRKRTLAPYLDFSHGVDANLEAFRAVAARMGVNRERVEPALRAAIEEQEAFQSDLRAMGAEALEELDQHPDMVGIILFGRSYNAFASVANKGIPAKFASRGVKLIPFDMLPPPTHQLPADHNMYWATGRTLLEHAQTVKEHPRLFGAYITNFSCGPDSFLIGYFRDIMGRKPSLTLELDSHTADAGIETRIEAFLDIVKFYRLAPSQESEGPTRDGFRPAAIEMRGGKGGVRTSSGDWVPLDDPRVRVLVPAMGRHTTPLLAKAFGCVGVRGVPLPPADEEMLKLGRGNSSCKECLPLQTTTGSLLHYLKDRPEGELTAYLMPSADGPCRFGQYHVFSKHLVEKQKLRDVAVLSVTSTDFYCGLGQRYGLAAWRSVIIGDLFDEMHATIRAAAVDRDESLAILEGEHRSLLEVIHKGWRPIARQLARSAKVLGQIRLTKPYEEIPKLSLVGEIYVRRDPISLQGLVERLAEAGFIVRTAQTSEWVKYVDWLAKHRIEGEPSLGFWMRHWAKHFFDKRIRRALEPAGLFHADGIHVGPVIEAARAFLSPKLTGEGVLTVGLAFHEILHPSCGVIAIGPFGCMPYRLAESILNEKFTTTEKRGLPSNNGHTPWLPILATDRKLPLLAIETDGNVFPQLIEARLEAFILQAQRLNDQLLAGTRAGERSPRLT
jgi:predicted CoA-substrate-specific enzyme activase